MEWGWGCSYIVAEGEDRLMQERIKTGGRACNCTTWLWSGRNDRLVPKYTFHGYPGTAYMCGRQVP